MPLFPYALTRQALFRLDPERAHDLTLDAIERLQRLGLSGLYGQRRVDDPISLAGLRFPNRVGLAAGLDKNARCIDGLAAMGFGFVEVGTVTPLAQPGNPKPRIFRLPEAQALINRLGFNNGGLDAFLHHVRQSRFRESPVPMLLGLNIGKNASTPIEQANLDYLRCLEAVYPHADYVTLNISSPNTQNLRSLQSDAALDALLGAVVGRAQALAAEHGRAVPLFLKIAPDLEPSQIDAIAASLLQHNQTEIRLGVIATNTTLSRHAVTGLAHANEAGGLSGAPVREASNAVVRRLRERLGADFPIIGVGGIMSAADALAKCEAGADVVQIYTGLIYHGPALVKACAEALKKAQKKAH